MWYPHTSQSFIQLDSRAVAILFMWRLQQANPGLSRVPEGWAKIPQKSIIICGMFGGALSTKTRYLTVMIWQRPSQWFHQLTLVDHTAARHRSASSISSISPNIYLLNADIDQKTHSMFSMCTAFFLCTISLSRTSCLQYVSIIACEHVLVTELQGPAGVKCHLKHELSRGDGIEMAWSKLLLLTLRRQTSRSYATASANSLI